jgi:hypothetical protein
MGLCKKILHNRKSKDLSAKNLQKLDSIQSEGGPKDPILLEALKRRFQFEKRHRYLKKVLKCKNSNVGTLRFGHTFI